MTRVKLPPRDTSSQRDAARKLNETKELLASVLASAPDYIYRLDRAGRITFANKVVPWLKPEQVIGPPLYRLLPADQRTLWRRKLDEVFRRGRVVGFESLGKMTEGGRRVFSNRMAPVRVDGRIEAVVAETRDVTAQRRLEEEARRNEELLSSILYNAQDAIFVLDRRGRFRFLNRASQGSPAALIGKSLWPKLTPEARSIWKRRLRSVLATRRAASFETKYVDPSGRVIWYSNRVAPIVRDGRADTVAAICTDISERKSLELKLSQSESDWRTLLEQAPDFICNLDFKGRFQYVNRYAPGLTPAMVLGKPLLNFIDESSKRKMRAAIKAVIAEGKPVNVRARGAVSKGSMGWYETTLAPIKKDGRVASILSVGRNITQEAMTQARFEGMFRSSQDSMNYTSLDGTLLEVNPAYQRMTGYSRDELILKRRYQDITAPEYREADRQAVRHLLSTGKIREFEKEWIRKDGTRIPVQITVFLVLGPDGRPEGMASIAKDITERRRLERESTEAGAREQSKLGRDLHDTLGQTVTGLSLLAKSLHGKLKRRNAPEDLEAARLVELSALAVRQARGLARGLLPKELQAAGLSEALRQLAANAQGLFGVACAVSLPARLVDVDEATAVQLYRIAQEAVHNAAKHARSLSGVRLKVTATGRTLRLEVADKGVGMPAAGRRGNGLGLGIMEHRARMVGGILTIKRHSAGGTIVTCVCPLPRPLQRSR